MTSRVLAFILTLSAGVVPSQLIVSGTPQTPVRPRTLAEALPYTDGSVWILEFARAREGSTDRLMEQLADDWKSMLDQATAEGLVLSYKVFLGTPAERRDWDVMTFIEVRNMAALDGFNTRLAEIRAAVAGQRKRTGPVPALSDMREVLATKIVREAILRQAR